MRNRALQPDLAAIAAAPSVPIQVVRTNPNYVFPWTILYDYLLPETLVGSPPPPVCFGTNAAGQPCGHRAADRVYCVLGFWGIRHVVEQIVSPDGGQTGGEPDHQVRRPNAAGAVRVAVGVSDSAAQALLPALQQAMGQQAVVEVTAADDLLDLLWRSDVRPAILCIVAHLEVADALGEPHGARMVLVPSRKWLLPANLADKLQFGGVWTQPQPIVFLMACGSAATTLETLNDFMLSFSNVGALAVIGTEVAVFSALVARFAQEVIVQLWSNQPLGAAVVAFRRQLLSERNPLGFVFCPVGDADLCVAPFAGAAPLP